VRQMPGASPYRAAAVLIVLALGSSPLGSSPLGSSKAFADTPGHFDINEFRVDGNSVLPTRDVERAVYNFLGPARGTEDVERARAALQDLYQQRGYPTVTVEVPRQTSQSGIVRLVVTERPIGRVRVTQARYFEPEVIRSGAPSLAPGTVPNINAVQRDMRTLNQWPGRAVTPELHPGRDPDTMDVDLKVTDQLPLRGSLELNNRRSANTTPLRLNGALGYDNLWQRGDSFTFFAQVAPQNPADALVYYVSYTFRIPDSALSLVVSWLKSDSNVTSIGGTDVVGKGQVAGFRLMMPLGGSDGFTHTLSAGADYKNFAQVLSLNGSGNEVPLTYYPVTIAYDAGWSGAASRTNFGISGVFGTPGVGSSAATLDANRIRATSRFSYLRASLSHEHDLPWGLQIWARAQGQATGDSLVPNEQFSAGGLDTVRGYLEAEALGDNAAVLQVEARGPSLAQGALARVSGGRIDELRPFLFADVAHTSINSPLPGQQRAYTLSSIGFGLRARVMGHVGAELENAYAAGGGPTTRHGADVVLFRLFGDF
jgi:hemolysin activation/secretion protein